MMEDLSAADKFKVVLDLISKIPEFDGNSSSLLYFFDRIDSLVPILTSLDSNSTTILSGFINDKIVGKARIEIQKHGRLNDWCQIKEVLKTNFAEKKSINTLIDQIRTARIRTNVEEYYNYLNNLISKINVSLMLENNNDASLIESNKRIAFDSFKHNLPEPTKSIVLSRNPSSLNEAYKIIVELGHQNFGPNSTQSFYRRNNQNHFSNLRYNNNFTFNRQNHSNSNFSNQNNNSNQTNMRQNNQHRQNRQYNNTQNNHFNNTNSQNFSNNNSLRDQSRRSNRNRFGNNTQEPMDITLNQNRNRNDQNVQNFFTTRRNNYPI